MRAPKKRVCPICGAKDLQIVETNHKQAAYNAAQVYYKAFAPDWEKIDEKSVSFQAVCGGTVGGNFGCGFTGPKFTYMDVPWGTMSGPKYCKSAGAAKNKATDAYWDILGAMSAAKEMKGSAK